MYSREGISNLSSIVSVGDISKPGPRTFTEAGEQLWKNRLIHPRLGRRHCRVDLEARQRCLRYREVHRCVHVGTTHLRIASKVVAEHAFWDYFKEQKPSFDGTAILPGAIFGPRKQFGAVVTGSVELMLPWVQGPVPEEQLSGEYFTMVHVTDGKTWSVSADIQLLVPQLVLSSPPELVASASLLPPSSYLAMTLLL